MRAPAPAPPVTFLGTGPHGLRHLGLHHEVEDHGDAAWVIDHVAESFSDRTGRPALGRPRQHQEQAIELPAPDAAMLVDDHRMDDPTFHALGDDLLRWRELRAIEQLVA